MSVFVSHSSAVCDRFLFGILTLSLSLFSFVCISFSRSMICLSVFPFLPELYRLFLSLVRYWWEHLDREHNPVILGRVDCSQFCSECHWLSYLCTVVSGRCEVYKNYHCPLCPSSWRCPYRVSVCLSRSLSLSLSLSLLISDSSLSVTLANPFLIFPTPSLPFFLMAGQRLNS